MNYLGITHMKDLYSENYKTLLREIKENLQMERYKKSIFICRFRIREFTYSLKFICDPKSVMAVLPQIHRLPRAAQRACSQLRSIRRHSVFFFF